MTTEQDILRLRKSVSHRIVLPLPSKTRWQRFRYRLNTLLAQLTMFAFCVACWWLLIWACLRAAGW